MPKSLDIVDLQSRGRWVLAIVGPLDRSTAPLLHAHLCRRLAAGRRRFLLDLARLSYLTSAGIRALLEMQREVERAGGSLALTNLPGEMRHLLALSGLHERFLIDPPDRSLALSG